FIWVKLTLSMTNVLMNTCLSCRSPPSENFSRTSLAMYNEIREAQAAALMDGAESDTKGMYS
ncbi:MAG: hypothetical protein AAFY09_15445, partial [Pseudomonadota bacterium]